jgi:hypothetical protein
MTEEQPGKVAIRTPDQRPRVFVSSTLAHDLQIALVPPINRIKVAHLGKLAGGDDLDLEVIPGPAPPESPCG